MRSTKAFIFVLRGSADIDQMTPVIWQCLKHDEHVHVVVASDFDTTSDFRLKFLQAYPNFTLRVLPGARFGTSFHAKASASVMESDQSATIAEKTERTNLRF